jgi:D-alanine-D-alanine ligase
LISKSEFTVVTVVWLEWQVIGSVMLKSLKITVLLGGPSAEREVSLRSGAAVAAALRTLGHEVTEIDPLHPGWVLPGVVDVVFLALHGTYGEDGTVQRHLESLGVRYTGCDSAASAVAFDKELTKQRLISSRISTPRSATLGAGSGGWPAGWQPPVVLKPVSQGSSVGLSFVETAAEFPAALAEAFRHDSRVLMEEKVVGRETTVGVLAGKALPVVEVRPRTGRYDYHSKYTTGASEYFCPADFDPPTTQCIQQAGLAAFEAIGGRDYARVDIMVRPDGEPVVLEVNTLPGMTQTSLLPKAAAAAGMSYPELCERMVELALQRQAPVLTPGTA